MAKISKKKIIIPVVALLILAVAMVIMFLPKEITQNNYFSAIQHSGQTQLVQNTTITENNIELYKKIETIIFDGQNAYRKLEEKFISTNPSEDFVTVITEEYFTQNKRYYKNMVGDWESEDFNISQNLKTYRLEANYFTSYQYDKSVKETGTFTGEIKDENINDVFNSQTNFKNAKISITVNNQFKVQTCNIWAQTETDRDVKVNNVFSYNQQTIVLPF